MINMTEIGQIYKCETCGNTVEVLKNGAGELVCCGNPMTLLEPFTEGDKAAKHLPVVEIDGNKINVAVGEVQHPMDDDHYIQFIEVELGEEKYIKILKPGDVPEASFVVDEALLKDNTPIVKEYCNLHGLWLK